jgi:hypothetical protein
MQHAMVAIPSFVRDFPFVSLLLWACFVTIMMTFCYYLASLILFMINTGPFIIKYLVTISSNFHVNIHAYETLLDSEWAFITDNVRNC